MASILRALTPGSGKAKVPTIEETTSAVSKEGQGAVQRGFAANKEKSPFDAGLEKVINCEAEVLLPLLGLPQVPQTEHSARQRKLLLARVLKHNATKYVSAHADDANKARAGILNGFKGYADKRKIFWRKDAAAYVERGMDVWEKELADATNDELVYPSYYEAAGVGTLHSYNHGNVNWDAAFDAPSAYLLVHCHHYPQLGAQEGFDALHADFQSKIHRRLMTGVGPEGPLPAVSTVVDLGCGVGTSTFALRKALDVSSFAGAEVTGVDLSPHFVTVAKHRAAAEVPELCADGKVVFKHGDGLDLEAAGFAPGSVDVVVISEVTHEMPGSVSAAVMRSIFKALRPGGVLGYMDLNPDQILKDGSVFNITKRLAMSNEPYLDEYCMANMEGAMLDAGFIDVERSWPNMERYEKSINCSLRFIVATKPLRDVK